MSDFKGSFKITEMAKKFGVSMAELQKLRKFQIFLMERKFKATEKMDFVNMVQLKTKYEVAIKRVSVASKRIYIDDGMIIIPCSRISNIITHQNEVILQFRTPIFGFGSTLSLTFSHSNIKDNFLQALGDINDSDDSDSSAEGSLTPPLSSSESNED